MHPPIKLERFADAFLACYDNPEAPPPSGVHPSQITVQQAYQIQRLVLQRREARGERPVGYKVGCTSHGVRTQFGLSEPICGRLMAPHVEFGHITVDYGAYDHCAVEPEFALRIARDITAPVEDPHTLIAAIEYVSPSVELHNYRFRFGEPTLQELIASNGIHAGLVIGPQQTAADAFDWDQERIGLLVDGELVAEGVGADILGGPLRSLRWLANILLSWGEALRAGDWVIPGSAVPLIRVQRGQQVEARFAHVGAARVRFG